jgi:hypothetical protein
MDLISREAVIDAIKELLLEPDSVQYIWSSDALSAVKHAHSINAVPIKAISVWLAAYAAPPRYAIDEIAGTDPGRIITVDTLVKAWEYHWKNLMACGLLQEEQDGTDNP